MLSTFCLAALLIASPQNAPQGPPNPVVLATAPSAAAQQLRVAMQQLAAGSRIPPTPPERRGIRRPRN